MRPTLRSRDILADAVLINREQARTSCVYSILMYALDIILDVVVERMRDPPMRSRESDD